MEVLDILQRIGYLDLRDCGKEWRARPLYRMSDNATSLCISKSTGDWYDFSARQGGSIMSLVQVSLGLKTLEDVKAFLGGDTVEVVRSNRYELTSIAKFDKNLLFRLQRDHTYWLNRQVPLETIQNFQGGITFNGRMAYRYVFPILNVQDELIGFSGRSLTDNPNYPKWKHIGKKSAWCYPLKWNREAIEKLKEVILVESIGDMLALWAQGIRNVLVTFGLDVSPAIMEYLIKIDVKRIIIAFNNDEEKESAGNHAATDAKRQLGSFFDSDQIIVALPEQNDFGVMTPEQITLWKQQYQIKS